VRLHAHYLADALADDDGTIVASTPAITRQY
jgi:hypothetical protein